MLLAAVVKAMYTIAIFVALTLLHSSIIFLLVLIQGSPPPIIWEDIMCLPKLTVWEQ